MRTFQLSLLAATLMLATGLAHAAGGEIAVIVKTSSSNYWQNVQKGANAAMGQLKGYTMTFQGPAAETAIADEVNMVENAVNRKVAGIVLAPSDPDALVPAVKKAWEAHIPVVIIDSALSDSGKQYYQSFLSTDNKKAGELCAKALIDRVGPDRQDRHHVLRGRRGLGNRPGRRVPRLSEGAFAIAGGRTFLFELADGDRAESDHRHLDRQSRPQRHLRRE